MAGLTFEMLLDNKGLLNKLSASERRILGFSQTATRELSSVEETFRNIGAGAAGYFAFTELSSLPKKLIEVRGEFQSLSVAYSTMLGSKKKADQLLADVTKFAASTPFDVAGVGKASKQLLAYGIASEDIIDKLRRLGDISSGLNIPLGELTDLYGKTKTNGRLFAEDLNQYLGRGINLIPLLADQFKVAESDVRGLVEAGRVGFPQVEIAINQLTDAGGKFAGLMAENSKTLTGLYANFEDAVTKAFANIGKDQEALLGESIKFGTLVADNYQPILDTLSVIIAGYGSYRAAIIATAVVQAAAAKGGAIVAWLELATSIRSAKDAQIAFNLATKANPYAVAASALIALITAVSLFSDETNEATKAQERALAISDKINQTKAEETSKVQILAQQIKDETRSREDRNKKLKDLIAISPQHFNALNLDNIATTKGADAIRDYTKALEKKLKVQASEETIVGNNKRIQDIKSGALNDEFKPGTFDRAKLFFEDSGFDEKKFKAETEKRKAAAIKALESENQALLKIAAEGEQARTGPASKPVAPKAEIDKKVKEEKEVRIKTFAEEIEEKKQMYQLYQRWIDNFGKEAADKQFEDLIKRNQDYVSYLDSKLEEIETAKNYQGFNTDDKKNVDLLITEKTEAKGGKSAIDQYIDKLAEAKQEAGSLTEYLGYLKQAQDELNSQPPTTLSKGQLAAVAQASVETRRQLQGELSDYLAGVAGSEARRLEIQRRYADLRTALEKRTADKRSDSYLKALKDIDEGEKKAFEDDRFDASKGKKEFEELKKIAELHYSELKKLDVKKARENFQTLTEGLDKESKEYQEHYDYLLSIQEGYNKKRGEAIMALGGIASQVAEIFSEMDGGLGNSGQAIGQLATQMVNLSNAMANANKTEKGKFDFGSMTNIIAYIAELVTFAIKTNKKLRAELDAYVSNYQDFQQSVALSENDKKGSAGNSNPFYTDYDAMVDSGISQYEDAMSKYEQAIAKLSTGKVVVGYDGGFWKKDRNVYAELLKIYPQLVDEAGNLNREYAEALLNTNQLDDNSQKLVQSAADWAEQMEKANEQIMQVAIDLTGQLGDILTDAMVTGFENGEEAAVAFGETVGDVIGDIVKKTILLDFLQPVLDRFQADVSKSLSKDGDKNIVDDLERFKDYGLPAFKEGFDYVSQMNEYFKSKGFGDVFGSGTGIPESGNSPIAQQGTISGASQESINILNGSINALRISNVNIELLTINHVTISRNALLELTSIKQNTNELYAIRQSLDRIDRLLSTDFLRAIGG